MPVHTRVRSWLAVLAAAATLVAPDAAAQTPSTGAGAPAMRAAGMALRDGALAPGMLTVRVVRGSFDRNAANETVQVDVDGRLESATTDAGGRAQFAHLPIGASVQATAVVDGEPLVSERFAMAAESGIRVLLIAGAGAASASGIPTLPVPEAAPGADAAAGGSAAQPQPAASPDDATVTGIRVAFVMTTVFALALVVFGKYGWRPWRPRRTPEA
ncbi:MAG TPA: hypothetical protein VFN38_04210 [Gemmatimonadaceae bacterium]|nr:hypothetical protein [Gemmatimonadaceae bacterium]